MSAFVVRLAFRNPVCWGAPVVGSGNSFLMFWGDWGDWGDWGSGFAAVDLKRLNNMKIKMKK